jgi:chromosomal replication initiation ATPase DnaA
MKDLFPECKNCINNKLENLLVQVSKATGTTVKDLKSRSRKRELNYPRFTYCKLAKSSYPVNEWDIGKPINRKRSAVRNAIRQVNDMTEAWNFYQETIQTMGI